MTTRLLTTDQRTSFLLSRCPVVLSSSPQLRSLSAGGRTRRGELLAPMTPDSPAPATAEASPAPRTINPAIDVMMEPQRGFNLRQFWHALLERLWIVGLCVLAGLFVALGYLGRTPKTYQSHAVLEVDFQEPTFVAGDDSA